MSTKDVLLSVESDELLSLVLVLDNNFVALHHVCIKAMHRLTISHHDVVGDVDDIINRTKTYDGQPVLQPFRRLLHFAPRNAHASVAAACFRILDFNVNRKRVVCHLKFVAIRTMKRCLHTIGLHPRIEVACHAVVRETVGAVCRDVHFDEPIALDVVVLGSRSTHLCIFRQDDDAGMVVADAYLVFCTNHATRLHAAQL